MSYRNEAKTAALEARGTTTQLNDFEYLVKNRPEAINIVAEGDSWFDYPKSNILFGANANILDWITELMKGEINMLQLDDNGDEAMEMLTGKQKHKLFQVFEDYGNTLNFFLFSGGGNDIVGQFDLEFILMPGKYVTGMTASDCINTDRSQRKLNTISNLVTDLMCMRNDFAPDCHIITHTYDIPAPSNRGVRLLGGLVGGLIDTTSWIKPYLDRKEIPNEIQIDIVRILLGGFQDEMIKLEASVEANGKFHVLRTQGLLNPGDHTDWINEIHPSSSGFKKIANLFISRIRSLL